MARDEAVLHLLYSSYSVELPSADQFSLRDIMHVYV